MKVIFAHGKESGPWGFKIRHLAGIARARGCAVESIDYSDLPDPDDRVARLVEYAGAEPGPFALVGSSMGGYVSLVASAEIDPVAIFLLAPALYLPEFGSRQADYPLNSSIDAVAALFAAWLDAALAAADGSGNA